MIGGEVESVEEVRPEYGLSDVSDDEGEVEGSVGDAYLAVGEAVAGDFRTVGRL